MNINRTTMKPFNPKLALTIALLLALMTSCKKTFNDALPATAEDVDELRLRAGKPNIILIIGDDIGYEVPQYTGGQSYNTPNLNFMAANGMQFTNFFSHPDGPPSRLALVTGKYNFRNWVKFGLLPDTSKTIANMLQNAGYKTCYIGKWQFDGGDASIKKHGFEKYRVFQPFNIVDNNGMDQFHGRYKSPYLYENASFLPENFVKNKYSEDLFYDYASAFIDDNKGKPFFIEYSLNLAQHPWSPTPDDPDYATWNPDIDDSLHENKKYFPGMVAYMDKMIGKLIKKIDSGGLTNNTIILFTSDNATNKNITSRYKGSSIKGGKNYTDRRGLSVPLVVYGPGKVKPGAVDTSLVDMTDFLPTFAGIANISKPSTWGPLDGVSFFDNLKGAKGNQRTFVYCYWNRDYMKIPIPVSYSFDYNYKLYDHWNLGKFYNIAIDPLEKNRLLDSRLTISQKLEKQKLKKILNSYAGY